MAAKQWMLDRLLLLAKAFTASVGGLNAAKGAMALYDGRVGWAMLNCLLAAVCLRVALRDPISSR